MARPKKTGLDYFPFDVDFFEDEKMIAIAGEFGLKGEIVAVKLLCAVYRNGYFIEWSDMLKMKMLRSLPGISPELFDQILNRLVRWGFFDASLFDSVKVLTSRGIQRRYFEAIKRRKTDGDDIPYLLDETGAKKVNVCRNPVNVSNNPVNVSNNPQSKVKERKEKPPKGGKKKAAPGGATFCPPTVGDVEAYAGEMGYEGMDAARFCAFYDSKGWMVGRNKMRDWRAAVRGWHMRDKLLPRRPGTESKPTVAPASYLERLEVEMRAVNMKWEQRRATAITFEEYQRRTKEAAANKQTE